MEAQNAHTPTGQLAPPTWGKSSFFVLILHSAIMAICGIFRYVRKKPSAGPRENLPPTPKSSFQQVQTYIDPTKKIWTEIVVATLRTTILKMPSLMFGEIRWVAIFHQNAKNRSFYELRQDFWFKSFLLDQKYIIFYEYLRYLVIARHYSSLLVIFRHFLPFWWYGKSEENSWKWAVRTSNDE